MYWQREIFRSGVGMTFNQTYELELPQTGLLGSIVLYIRSTQNAAPFATAVKWRLIDYISKIEIVPDGGTPIKSLDGRQALACAYYDGDGMEPPSMWRHYSNTPHRQWIPIHFGRQLHDEQYGLDLSRYNRVRLKIANDATATQFTTDIDIDVVLYWLREGPSTFAGFFRDEEWQEWDPVAGDTRYLELPTEYAIRRILLRGRPGVDTADAKNNSSLHRLMDSIKFTLRSGVLTVYDGSLEDLGHLSVVELGKFAETRGAIDRTQGYGFETGVGYVMQNVGAWTTDADGLSTVLGNMRQDVQDSAQEMGYRTANGMLAWLVRGHGYMHNVPLFTARKPDLSDLLDPSRDKVVKLDIRCQSGTTVSGTDHVAKNAVILSRLVR